ncbi:PhoX family phosphatase [Salinicola corii]|uniref:PhoX family phosphatase n=1 Tax=Salinicola corii TaxID=2606937 RepID=A0A640WHU2_9GAMM|nr:PhoX family phosphatase [Salinicola corii]KAA0019914.1 PhoX family phosphatase [Salinicola corii]
MSKEIEDHRILNRSDNEPFSAILDRRVSRRGIMQGGLGVAAMTVLGGFGLAGCSDDDDAHADDQPAKTPLALAFESVKGSKTDAIVVPAGYSAQVLIPWGTPLNSSARDWNPGMKMTPEDQLNMVGMQHDGMHNFPLDEKNASSDFLLAMNNEYIDQTALWFQDGPTSDVDGKRPADEVRTEINAHGVTIVRLKKQGDGSWVHDPSSLYNRRITSATSMDLAGPVAGSDYVKTKYSKDGKTVRGTNNNCANGYTPWGTYLTCEENWPGYFIKKDGREMDDDRLGIEDENGRYGWETAAGDASEVDDEFARFDTTPRGGSATDDYRNEARGFGYIVEIDPYSDARAIKRTHLGRFRHEGCWPGKLVEGEPVVFYSGHDSRNEYIYKFVSKAVWDPADANRPGDNYDRLSIGAKYMDEGTLYVAKFNDDGTGEWLPLTPDAQTPGGKSLATALGLDTGDLAGIIVHTCDAADLMGATPMDRPEWGTVDPHTGEVYMTLTNNSDRTEAGTDATFTSGNSVEELGVGYASAPVNGPNPRAENEGGQVIRWVEPSPKEATFEWDIFVCGAASGDADNLSGLTELNQFASPDGLWYDDRGDGKGILWIETDNGYENVTEDTNDQLLAVVPAAVSQGEGDTTVIGSGNQTQLKRFLVGPNGCEVTGICATPDKSALFINIQHPGNWPADDSAATQDATKVTSGTVRPRASTVVIWKNDGGQIGL